MSRLYIVTMPDGMRYMADITNCDEGTIGYPDQLFLRTASSHPKEDEYCYMDDRITYIYDGFMSSVLGAEELELADASECVTVQFVKGEDEAEGEQYTATVGTGSFFTLPPCQIHAPTGKMFAGWLVNGVKHPAGDIIILEEDMEIEALWADEVKDAELAQLEGTYYSAESDK